MCKIGSPEDENDKLVVVAHYVTESGVASFS